MWICSQGLKRVPPSRGNTQANARGLSLDTAGLEGLPDFPKLPPWPPSHCASPLPCPSPWTGASWHQGECLAYRDLLSAYCSAYTWKSHKDVQGLKTCVNRERKYIQKLVKTEAKRSNAGRRIENKEAKRDAI